LIAIESCMAERVRITEVGPRDGLQNEPGVIPTEQKVRLVELCCATGVDEVEATSFVSPKWVPQLGDAREVLQGVYAERDVQLGLASSELPSDVAWKAKSPMFSALVPNIRGMDDLVAGSMFDGKFLIEKVSVFTAASETFSRKNTNASIAETIERFRPVVERAKSCRMLVRGYVSCAIACPFEGPIPPASVANVCSMLAELGVDEIDLGDTIGAGVPETVSAMIEEVGARLGPKWLSLDRMTLHLHDTFGRAADCVKAALDLGVRSFDGSVAGLGGCPYASTPGKRAPGNISTETLVRTVHEAGFETGVDLDKLRIAAEYAREIVGRARAGGGCA
jgi:hydroxymethylglutaryl-CoA lyase